MGRRIIVVFGLFLAFIGLPAGACTIFTLAKDGVVLAGNNEDWYDTDTRMWVVPAAGGSLGVVYFGFGNLFPQGGVNEAGLFFDGNALPTVKMTPTGRPAFAGNLLDHIMRTCATVQEALALISRFDTQRWFASAQLHFADRTGDAAVVESGGVFRRTRDFLISTNFRMSEVPSGGTWPCVRFRTAERMLSGAGEATVDVVAAVLKATSVSITRYSNVYDLTHGIIHLYQSRDYSRSVPIVVADEVAKGGGIVTIESLFADGR